MSSTLYVDNLQPNLGSQVVIPQLKPLAGSVVQVQSTNTTLSFSTSSGTFSSLGLSVSITPTSTTSKILVIASYGIATQTSNLQVTESLFRDSTELNAIAIHYGASSGFLTTTHSLHILDAPTTTSTITYEVKARIGAGAGTASTTSPATITAMEIAQ